LDTELRLWQREADTAGLRDEAALLKLPKAERLAWRDFWQEVEALRGAAEAEGVRSSLGKGVGIR
jgi:hypothetical protein